MKNNNIKEYIIKLALALLAFIIVAITILGIVYADSIFASINNIIDIISPFLYGALIAYLLIPLYNIIKNKLDKGKFKRSKFWAVVLTETAFIVLIIVCLVLIIPQTVTSIKSIIEQLPDFLDKSQNIVDRLVRNNNWLNGIVGNGLGDIKETLFNSIRNYLFPNMDIALENVWSGITQTGSALIKIILGIVTNILILYNKDTFSRQASTITYAICGKKITDMILDEVHIANNIFSRFMFGKFIDSLIIGIICFIFCMIVRMPYALLISVIVCITNMIPIIGPFIGAIPSILIILGQSPSKAITFSIFILILQQIDGHIIGPKCIGNATGLTTFWVLFAIILFGGLWGIIGMLIGVPLFAVIYDLIRKLVYYVKDKRDIQYHIKDNINE